MGTGLRNHKEILEQNYLRFFAEMMMIMISVISCENVQKAPTSPNSQFDYLLNPNSSCSTRCGSLSIPFPFGTSDGCYLDKNFLISCDSTTGKAYLGEPYDSTPVLDISLKNHEVRVSIPLRKTCLNSEGHPMARKLEFQYPAEGNDMSGVVRILLTPAYFYISRTRNKLTSVGCNTVATIYSYGNAVGKDTPYQQFSPIYQDACVSSCPQDFRLLKNGTCDPFSGCCQKSIPVDGITYSTIGYQLFNKTDYVDDGFDISGGSTPQSTVPVQPPTCGYAFVAETDAFEFSSLDLREGVRNRDSVPIVFDWAVGNYNNCVEAHKSGIGYACQAKDSQCHNFINGIGYICKCRKGFQGNPYIDGGCKDIDECESELTNPCVSKAKCTNNPGTAYCVCPKGYTGNGKKNGTGCSNQNLRLTIALGNCIAVLVLLLVSFWIYWGVKKRKLVQLKMKFFKQNGGILLQQLVSGHRQAIELIKLFSEDELKKATSNYDEGLVIGEGATGRVYRGLLQCKKVVAIKKSKVCDRSQIQQFINEVIVLFQINHRNVVKLLGCCLETEVPILVYECITNGNLWSHLHTSSSRLSWKIRLKIAKEVAGALAYLHSDTSIPIIHRDVKTSNVLLDDSFTAKISDFGASRLIPIGETQIVTLAQGTYGYFDPEYFCSGKLTEKSDVYGFGVVLAELLTGKEALFWDSTGSRRGLAMYLVSSVKNDCLVEILDDKMGVDEQSIVVLKDVASLAMMCLSERGEQRPTMKEVQTELEGIVDMEE